MIFTWSPHGVRGAAAIHSTNPAEMRIKIGVSIFAFESSSSVIYFSPHLLASLLKVVKPMRLSTNSIPFYLHILALLLMMALGSTSWTLFPTKPMFSYWCSTFSTLWTLSPTKTMPSPWCSAFWKLPLQMLPVSVKPGCGGSQFSSSRKPLGWFGAGSSP